MPPELIALIDKPILLGAVLAVGALVGIGVERLVEGEKRAERRAYRQRPNVGKARGFNRAMRAVPLKHTSERAPLDAAEQLRTVMAAEFTARPLLNKGEARVFVELDRMVVGRNPDWQVMAQVAVFAGAG